MLDPDRSDRLDRLLDARDLEAVWFARPNGFAWLTGGDNVVDRERPVGVAAAGYDGDSVTVVTDTIEAPRLRAEELPDGIDVLTFRWYEGSLLEAVVERSPTPAAADVDVPGFEPVDGSSLRQPLSAADVDRYRELGRETAAAVETGCRSIDPEATERAVAADLRRRLVDRGIDAPVVLVGGAERAPKYRHYTPTDAKIDGYALVSVTAVRGGLHASCTRAVAFDPPAWLDERHDAAVTVEVAALAATVDAAHEDGTAGDVFGAIRDAYAAVGYPEEWRKHHQGGAAGFAGREWIATPESDDPVTAPMAYAWNPTVEGAKSEDTALVTDGGGIDVLTETGDWPTRRVESPAGGLAIERHDPLYR